MSNLIVLTRTKFMSINDDSIQYGYRLIDDYTVIFNDCHHITEMSLPPVDFFRTLLQDETATCEQEADLFYYIYVQEVGLEIDGKWFDFEKIKHCFEGTVYAK